MDGSQLEPMWGFFVGSVANVYHYLTQAMQVESLPLIPHSQVKLPLLLSLHSYVLNHCCYYWNKPSLVMEARLRAFRTAHSKLLEGPRRNPPLKQDCAASVHTNLETQIHRQRRWNDQLTVLSIIPSVFSAIWDNYCAYDHCLLCLLSTQ